MNKGIKVLMWTSVVLQIIVFACMVFLVIRNNQSSSYKKEFQKQQQIIDASNITIDSLQMANLETQHKVVQWIVHADSLMRLADNQQNQNDSLKTHYYEIINNIGDFNSHELDSIFAIIERNHAR